MYKREFERCIQPIITEIAMRAYQGKPQTDGLDKTANKCLERFSQVMNGGVNVTTEDIAKTLEWVLKVEVDFYDSLKGFLDILPNYLEIVPPNIIYADSYWDSGIISGCNIKTGDCYLYATPKIPAATFCWMALVQEPVAATVLAVKDSCVLMLPSGQYTSEDFYRALIKVSEEQKNVTTDFKHVFNAKIQSGFLFIDSKKKMDIETLNKSLEKYRVGAIIKVNLSQQTGFIFTGDEENMPKLQRIIYYEWHENWKIYNN